MGEKKESKRKVQIKTKNKTDKIKEKNNHDLNTYI